MCLTEALMIKALLVTNFNQFSGINDSFFSLFAVLINIGFSLGSHIALFSLGSLGLDDIFTGIKGKPRQMSLYYVVTIGALSAISCFSLTAIGIKRFEAYRKDKKLVKDVNVMLKNTDSRDGRRSICLGVHNSNTISIPISVPFSTLAINMGERARSAPPFLPSLDRQPKKKLNNHRYNKPVLNTVVLASLTILIAGSILAYIVVFNVNGSTSDYIKSVWFGWAGSIFFRSLLPVWIIAFHHTDFRTFIFKTWHDLWSNVCLQNNRVQPIL
jgi:hypothetical protein